MVLELVYDINTRVVLVLVEYLVLGWLATTIQTPASGIPQLHVPEFNCYDPDQTEFPWFRPVAT